MESLDQQPASPCDVTPAQCSTTAPVGDTDAAIAFLKAMHPSTPWVLTVLDPEQVENSITETFGPETEVDLRTFVEEWNGKRGLYFSTNPLRTRMRKKAKATDVAALAYLHVDIDPRKGEDIKAERARILSLLTDDLPAGIPKPTAIVFSGGGYQAFWKLETPLELDGSQKAADKAKLWNLGLKLKFAGADSCHNIDRIMRLPGTINVPNKKKREKGRVPTLATLVEADWSRVYPLSDFEPASPTPPPLASSSDNDNHAFDVDADADLVKLLDVHDLDKYTADGKPVEDRVKRIIQVGFDELDHRPDCKDKTDRSRWVFDVACALVRRGVADNVILSALLDRDFRISDHIYDRKGNTRKYAARQIEQAKKKLAESCATSDGARKLVLNKSNPLQTARKFRMTVRPNLITYGSEWLDYQYGAYKELEKATVRAETYAFLDEAITPKFNPKEGESKLEAFKPIAKDVNDVLDALAAITHRPRDQFEPPAWLDGAGPCPMEIIACRNGLLHLATGELLPATPRFFTRNALAFDYQPEAPEPRQWLTFLNQLWPGGEEIATLQEIFGYLLVPDTSQQKIFLLVGPKRSGKGTIATILTALIGARNVCSPSLNSLGDTFALQPLIGKQLAIVSDMRIGFSTDTAAVAEDLLRISGEDAVTVNRKHKEAWTGRLGVRFLIMSNEVPRLPDASGALASRFVPLVMEKSFYGSEDPGLKDRLLSELPGILNWAVDGWVRLKERGHFVLPQSSLQSVDELEDMASPVKAFIRDMCELEPDAVTSKHQLWNAYVNWSSENNEVKSGSRQFFKNLIAASGRAIHPSKPRDGDKRIPSYVGIRIARTHLMPS
jgi:P4 family phage/plasmid primase-like protien